MTSLGSVLRAAREEKLIGLSQAAAATRIKVQMLDALEKNDFGTIAAPIYGKGFIKIYAEYLGLLPGPLIEEYMAQCHSVAPRVSGSEIVRGLPGEGARATEPTAESRPRMRTRSPGDGVGSQRKFALPPVLPSIGEYAALLSREPVRFVAIGVGVVILLFFLVSAVSRVWSRPAASPPLAHRTPDAGELRRELPAPYLDVRP